MLSHYRQCLCFLIVATAFTILLRTWTTFVHSELSQQGDTSLLIVKNLPSVVHSNQSKDQLVKRILFWYEPYKPKEMQRNFNVGIGQGPAGPSIHITNYRLPYCLAQCDIFNRDHIINWNLMKTFDAVIFHQRGWTPDDVPTKRWPHQKFVFLSMESPAWRFVDTESMANFFNWTMTYRQDSDIFNPYGSFKPVNSTFISPSFAPMIQRLLQETRFNPINYAAGKTKKIAWFVSNCKSLSARNEYVDRLKKFINVDIYGQCGTMRCPRSKPEFCRQMLQRDYKFYLAMENSLCDGYVTEKFFTQMRYFIVPIVFDLHGHHKRLAPPHSYINAADFPSVQKLADYLILLDKNDALYNEYFWWKKHFVISESHDDTKGGMCRLCNLLHNSTTSTKVYVNMTDWWDAQSKCHTVRFTDNNDETSTNYSWESISI